MRAQPSTFLQLGQLKKRSKRDIFHTIQGMSIKLNLLYNETDDKTKSETYLIVFSCNVNSSLYQCCTYGW